MFPRMSGEIWILIVAAALVCDAQIPPAPNHDQMHLTPSSSIPLSPEAENYCQTLVAGPESGPLEAACKFSLSLGKTMPNYVCEMAVEKYEDVSQAYRSTHYMQRIHARARFVSGKDYYDDLEINGKQSADTDQLIEGTWSFGEFGAKLLAAFNPKNHPSFMYERKTKIKGGEAFEYRFEVEHKNNGFWRWLFNRRAALPGYQGRLWVDAKGGNILRLQLDSTNGVPDDFPIQSVTSKTEYSWVDFKDKSGFILPTKVQIRTSMLDRRIYRTTISYSKCHRFSVDSHVLTETAIPR